MKRMVDWLKDLIDDVLFNACFFLVIFTAAMKVLSWEVKNQKRFDSMSGKYILLTIRMKTVEALSNSRICRKIGVFEDADDGCYEEIITLIADAIERGYKMLMH